MQAAATSVTTFSTTISATPLVSTLLYKCARQGLLCSCSLSVVGQQPLCLCLFLLLGSAEDGQLHLMLSPRCI